MNHDECAALAERGRQLASEREDLITAGADPAELSIPLRPECSCLDQGKTIRDGFRATEQIDAAHPRIARYPILPDDLLVRTGPHTYTKECPGVAVAGFVLTPDQEDALQPVKFSRDGLDYSILDIGEPTTIEVLACVDCADDCQIDPTTLLPSASDPCDCGCGWWQLLCQICGRVIGGGTSAGIIGLSDSP